MPWTSRIGGPSPARRIGHLPAVKQLRLDLGRHRRSLTLLTALSSTGTSRPAGFSFARPPIHEEILRSHGSRRRTNRRHPRVPGVQAAQLPDAEVQAQQSGPDRAAQVLPLVRQAHAAQGDALSARARACRPWRGTANGRRSARRAARPQRGRRDGARRAAAAARAGSRARAATPDARARAPEPPEPSGAREEPARRRAAAGPRHAPTTVLEFEQDLDEPRRTTSTSTRPRTTPRRTAPAPRPARRPRRGAEEPQGPPPCRTVPLSRSWPSCSASSGRTARPSPR